jgi:hypothetical protein
MEKRKMETERAYRLMKEKQRMYDENQSISDEMVKEKYRFLLLEGARADELHTSNKIDIGLIMVLMKDGVFN